MTESLVPAPIPHVPCECTDCRKERNLKRLKEACGEMTLNDLYTVAQLSEIMAARAEKERRA